MRRFDFYLSEELFDGIKLMSKFYNISICKMRLKLLEVGYIKSLEHKDID